MKIIHFLKLLLVAFFLLVLTKELGAQCNASFTGPSVRCQFNNIQFTFNGTAGRPRFRWNFGDPTSGVANSDTTSNPFHQFNSAGIFTVTLIVSDTGGCRDTTTKSIRILAKPVATYNVIQPCLGLTSVFSHTATKDTFDRFRSFYWLFGDGGSDTAVNPSHSYATYGNKTVTLMLTSLYGCKDTIITTLEIFDKVTLSVNKDSACIDNFVNFEINTGASSASSYKWAFGDGVTSTARKTSHPYITAGSFTPNAIIRYSNGATCSYNSRKIKIHPLPDAGFKILDSIHCYNYNSVCIKLKQSTSLTYRSISFDDGFVDNISALTDSIICHSYSDTTGGRYAISIAIIDKNQCVAISNALNKVTIYPKLEAKMSSSNAAGCFQTPFYATNLSNQKPPKITSFKWDFGDGNTDVTNWNSVTHTYKTNGLFNISLMIENSDGCRDTATNVGGVLNIFYTVDAVMDSALSLCRSTNIFQFRQTAIPNAYVFWDFGNFDSSFRFSADYHYKKPGIYFPKIFINKGGCIKTLQLDTIFVYGPEALIDSITNQFQCSIRDTVIFSNGSNYFGNKSRKYFWDLGDPYSPNCTTDTKNGLNINGNCRYSVDSSNIRHMYTPGQERCYSVLLIVTDTVIGCSDSIRKNLPLTKPDAKTGLQLISNFTCLGPEKYKQFELDLTKTKPGCAQQRHKVMWDSACARASSNFNSNWKKNEIFHSYGYNLCDSSGKITIGIVIENGKDTNNLPCTDTGWYHGILDFGRINPAFTSSYDTLKHYCKNTAFTFTITDTRQDSLTMIRWVWGDGTFFNAPDLSPVKHTFVKAGVYRVILYLELKDGCSANDTMFVQVGYSSALGASDNEICLGDSINLYKYLNYWGNNKNYWGNPLRSESLKWNLGDGNGFSTNSIQPWVTYPRIGNYTVWLATKDSAGCRDTLYATNLVRVFNIESSFTTIADTFVCAQFISFKSNVTVYDSTAMFGHGDDKILKYKWTFGSGLSNSILANPTKFFKAGTFPVKLLVENTRKCRDSITKNITILGPTAGFSFVGDSTGCQPLKITLKNTSAYSTAYTWYFGDGNNNSTFTTADTNITFTYPLYGNFYPKLTAQSSIISNGIPVTCRNTYPDTPFNASLRRLTVFENPKPSFTHITDCKNYQTAFTNTSFCFTDSIIRYEWNFGDGDTSARKNPVHQYRDTGRYTITLYAYTALGCSGSTNKLVIVAPYAVVWFKKKDVCIGNAIHFADSTESYNDQIAKWQWNFDDNTSSTVKNPSKTYSYDSVFNVTLTVTNFAGCTSARARKVKVYSRPKTNFNYTNRCFSEAIPLTNITTSKENPVKYLWTLGSDTSTSYSLSKLYPTPGNYPVKLKATNWFGCEDSVMKTVITYPLPVAVFTVNKHVECLNGNRFVFTDQSTTDTGSLFYKWSFGSFSNSTQKSPVQVYDSAGTFQIVMMAITHYNCRDTAYDTVLVNPNPLSKLYSPLPLSQCINPNLFIFTDSSKIITGTYSRKWDLGDNTASTNSTLSHSYRDSGTYKAKLMTMSNKNCPDTLRFNIRVNPKPIADFTINDFIQCINGNSFEFTNTSKAFYGTTTSQWYFGDNDSSASLKGYHSYNRYDTFTVKLIATNNTSCKDTISKIAIVYTKPATGYSVKDTLPCERDNLFLFTNSSSIAYGTMTYTWQFGDNRTASILNTSHSYDTFGTYQVSLIALSNHGCRDTVKKNVTVFPMPMPAFVVNDRTQCINSQDFIFTNKTFIGNGTFTSRWKLGENDSANTTDARKQFRSVNRFNVVVHLKSDKGCRDSTRNTVLTHPKPFPGFIANDSTQCINKQDFRFTNGSKIQKGSLTYGWKLGNGFTDTIPTSILYRYPAHGNYTVTLTAYSDSGCIDSFSKPVEVFPKPVSNITANDSGQCINTNLFLFKGNYTIPYGLVNGYYWNLDGTFKKGTADTSKRYPSTGNYSLGFIAESSELCRDTSYLNVILYPKPKSGFMVNDSAQCVNDNLFRFINRSSFAFGPLRYRWDYGNGSTDTITSPVRIFTLKDTLLVSLIPSTQFYCMDTFTSTIIIFPKPGPAYTVNDSTQCVNGNLFRYVNTSRISSGKMTYTWETGDGHTEGQLDTGHIYRKEGTYKVMLRALSSEGCVDSFYRYATIYPKPLPDFSINKLKQCLNDQLYIYTNKSTIAYGTLRYEWKTGDGNKADSPSINYRYTSHGLYTVQLKAISEKSCSDSIKKDIRVFAKPMMKFAVNDSTQCINDQDVRFTSNAGIAEGSLIRRYWKFGDGGKDSGNMAAHRYKPSAFYTVTHTAISDNLCIDSVKRVLRIYPKPKAAFLWNDSAQCIRSNYYIFNDGSFDSSGIKTTFWDINSEQTFYTPSVRYIFTDTSFKLITLLVTSNNGCKDTTARKVYLKRMPDPSFTKLATYYCRNTPMVKLVPVQPGGIYFGKNMNNTFFNPGILWNDTVKYIVTFNGCTDSSVQYTKVLPPPKVNLGNDTQLCLYEYIDLNASSWDSKYKWNTSGNDYPQLRVLKPGKYYVTVTNICGTASDTVKITFKDINCRFMIPNAFTPNGDEVNEFFRPSTVNVPILSMQIYNRWGEKVYDGNQDSPGWDGNYQGEMAPQDVYLWVVYYRYPVGDKSIELNEKGTFQLLR